MPGRSPTKLLGEIKWSQLGRRGPLPWSPEAGPEWTGTRVLPGQGLFQGFGYYRPAAKMGDTALAYVLHDHHDPPPPLLSIRPCRLFVLPFGRLYIVHTHPDLFCFYGLSSYGLHFVNELQGKTPLKIMGLRLVLEGDHCC